MYCRFVWFCIDFVCNRTELDFLLLVSLLPFAVRFLFAKYLLRNAKKASSVRLFSLDILGHPKPKSASVSLRRIISIVSVVLNQIVSQKKNSSGQNSSWLGKIRCSKSVPFEDNNYYIIKNDALARTLQFIWRIFFCHCILILRTFRHCIYWVFRHAKGINELERNVQKYRNLQNAGMSFEMDTEEKSMK